jgi:hypothetical protein
MERTRFVDHKGKRILLLDYSGMTSPEEEIAEIRHSIDVVAGQPRDSLLVLTDVSDARYNAASLQALKELAAHNAPFVTASAVVGITGLRRIAYQAVIVFSKRNIRAFDTREAAKDWLVTQG